MHTPKFLRPHEPKDVWCECEIRKNSRLLSPSCKSTADCAALDRRAGLLGQSTSANARCYQNTVFIEVNPLLQPQLAASNNAHEFYIVLVGVLTISAVVAFKLQYYYSSVLQNVN